MIDRNETELIIEFATRYPTVEGQEWLSTIINRRRLRLRNDSPAVRVEYLAVQGLGSPWARLPRLAPHQPSMKGPEVAGPQHAVHRRQARFRSRRVARHLLVSARQAWLASQQLPHLVVRDAKARETAGRSDRRDPRGLLDLLMGGVGMRRGRRDPDSLMPGDTLDFWRVEATEANTLLRLYAEMKLPGRAWLQFEVEPVGEESIVRQTAIFDPVGLLGLAYWYGLYPLHQLVFGGMLRGIVEASGDGANAKP